MRRLMGSLTILLLVGSGVAFAKGKPPVITECPTDVGAALATACPCEGGAQPWKNHGGYVSCVVAALPPKARSSMSGFRRDRSTSQIPTATIWSSVPRCRVRPDTCRALEGSAQVLHPPDRRRAKTTKGILDSWSCGEAPPRR